nr:MAG TPA: hypothetical protein [Caudoviricetes sp.]
MNYGKRQSHRVLGQRNKARRRKHAPCIPQLRKGTKSRG